MIYSHMNTHNVGLQLLMYIPGVADSMDMLAGKMTLIIGGFNTDLPKLNRGKFSEYQFHGNLF